MRIDGAEVETCDFESLSMMEKKSKGEDGGGGGKRTQIMRDRGAGVASGPFGRRPRRRPHHRDRLRRCVACA